MTDPAHVERTPTPVTLRRMQEGDLPLLHAWLQRPHIVLWWGSNDGSLSRDEIRARHLPGKDAGVCQYMKKPDFARSTASSPRPAPRF